MINLFRIHISLQHAWKSSVNMIGYEKPMTYPRKNIVSSGWSNRTTKENGEKPSITLVKDLHFLWNNISVLQLYCFKRDHLIGARMVYNRRNKTIIIAPPKVKVGLFQKLRFDLSVLLIGSTSSERGNSERLGFQLTYLSENLEKGFFPPCFLNFDHALSQSVEDLSPETFNQQL